MILLIACSRKGSLAGLITLFCLVLLVAQGCRNARRQTTFEMPAAASEKAGSQEEIIMPGDSLHFVYKGLKAEVPNFYKSHSNRPVWLAGSKLSQSGDSLMRFISGIRYYGLVPANYHFDEIFKHVENGFSDAARVDALMTDAFMSIVKDLMFGRLKDWDGTSDSITTHLLTRVMKNGGIRRCFNSVEPQVRGYQQLKRALKIVLDSLSSSQRLAVFQNSGEIPDSLDARIQAIEINLERWRSETDRWGHRYIFVNIPAFMLYVISDDAVAIESRVIVGKAETPTPELTSALECLVTYPYWHVPRKIAVEEYLPIIQRDTSFLGRNNFDVLDRKGLLVDPDSLSWGTFNKNYFPLSLRQREGPENSLGILKFVFDNPYAVFLHDTNGRRLFDSSVRTFSHGCIRMEKAVELSHFLITGEVGKRSKLIDRYLKESLRHTINLPSTFPIYIRYFTVGFKGDSLVFYKDIYHKDESVIKGLYGANIESVWRP